MLASCTLNISIACHRDKAYAFIAAPENLPKWAAGLGNSIRKSNEGWIAETAAGPAKIHFAEINAFGVLDHYVTLPSGAEIYVPMRVLSNGDGCEVIFTLFQQADMLAEKLAEDVALVEWDLAILKQLLEK